MGNQNGTPSEDKNHIIYNSNQVEQYIGEKKNDQRNGQGTYIYGNGDRYIGEWLNDSRHGKGKFYYRNGELYIGEWKENQKHGDGTYFYQNGERYAGNWRNNLKEGKGSITLNDGSVFRGFFHENKKHGPGTMTRSDGIVYEEEWDQGALITQIEKSMGEDTDGKNNKLEDDSFKGKNNEKLDQNKNDSPNIQETPKEDNNNPAYDDFQTKAEEKPNNLELDEDNIVRSLEKSSPKKFESMHSKDLLSEIKSEVRNLDAGYDTLSLIDQIEMFNSLNSSFLNKNIQDWTTDDVGEWLTIIGLSEYVENFSSNHINGKILFDISEKELKDDLDVISIGHRKNFQKAVKHLKRFYSKNRLYSDSVKKKLIRFYEKHHKQLKMGNIGFSNKLREVKPKAWQEEEAIEEEQNELSCRESPAPQLISNDEEIKHNKIDDEFSLEIKEESECDENNEVREEDKKIMKESDLKKNKSNNIDNENIKEKKGKDLEIKKQKSNISTENSKILDNSHTTLMDMVFADNEEAPEVPDQSTLKYGEKKKKQLNFVTEGNNKEIEESENITAKEVNNDNENKGENLKNNELKPDGINEAGPNDKESSDSDSESTSSEEEKKKVRLERVESNVIVKKKHRLTKNKLEKANSKKNENGEQEELEPLTYDQKFIMKTFKVQNIANFLIDYKELETLNKIGEGGYGDVFLGKWLGQEVAIKQYGKNSGKKRSTKKTTDFIKEVEVISNLRHPNIVLYMGVCINFSNYLMITEYLEGGSLFDILHKKHLKLEEDRVFLVAEDIALGMNYLHDRKVLHCDLKSSNILIDSNWNIKLCDFGLSRVKSKLDRKRNKGRVGTPHWMAPEIMRGEKYDEFSDIYSYGMILWEMITGETPYKGYSIPQIIGAVGFDNYQVPLPTKGNLLILKLMEKCLNRDRSERPNFKYIVENLQNRNRAKEKKNEVLMELKNFFGD